ncbi:MAG: ABC transporter permease [Candidatus Woesearchaeota archaeon]
MKFEKSMLANLAALVKKNIKMLVRAKSSALIVVLGPLLIILLAGLAFDNSDLYSVKIGTFSEKYNDVSNSFIEKLSQKQFKVIRYPDSGSCTKGIELGEVHTCIIFSPNFEIASNNSNKITFFVDYSKINLVWTVLNVMTTRLSEKSMEMSRNLTTILVNALEFSSKEIASKKPSLVQLTTANDEMGRRVTDISVRLEEVDLGFDVNEIGVNELDRAKNKVKHWVDNSLSIGRQSLQRAKEYMSTLSGSLPASTLSDAAKQNLMDSLKDNVEDIAALEDKMKTTEQLVSTENAEFEEAINKIIGKLTQTKAQLDSAVKERDTTLDELAIIRDQLDASLKNLLNVQKTFNNIENMIKAVEVKDPEALVQPIVTEIKPITSEKTYLNYVSPTLIVLVLLFTALLLAPTMILLEKTSSAYFRNYMMPVKDIIFILATFFSCFFLMLLQTVVILAIAAIFFSSQIFSGFHYTILVLLALITSFTFLGMIIGYLFNSEETATLAGISAGSVLLFMSDVIIPIESMPEPLLRVAEFNPFIIGSDLLRSTIIYNASFADISAKFLTLIVYCILFGAFALRKKLSQSLLASLRQVR